MILDALKNGKWVFLQNCHLAVSWLLSMEELIKTFTEPGSAALEQDSSTSNDTYLPKDVQQSVSLSKKLKKRANHVFFFFNIHI